MAIQVMWGRDTRPTMPRHGGDGHPTKTASGWGRASTKTTGRKALVRTMATSGWVQRTKMRPYDDPGDMGAGCSPNNGDERVGLRADKGNGQLGLHVEKGDEQMGPRADKGDGRVESSANKDGLHKARRRFAKHCQAVHGMGTRHLPQGGCAGTNGSTGSMARIMPSDGIFATALAGVSRLTHRAHWDAQFYGTSTPHPPPAKWHAQAILPDGIKLGGTWLVTKSNEVIQLGGLKPSQAIPPNAIKLGGDVACDDNGGEALTDETQEDVYG
ncbi:hypothetical protein B0H14DRAFT_2648773 [Mycena olivaceomarginata]|nr:hypothetical protein B0H14DRAFT_2648773 [Mycena olivaceomarginata]